MNLFKKLMCLALALCMLTTLAACGGSSTDPTKAPGTDATKAPETAPGYRVTVTDYAGNPVTRGVVVCFSQNGQQVAMQSVNEEGVAVKELEPGNYTVSLMFSDTEVSYTYDEEGLELTADTTELHIQLAAVASKTETLVHKGTEYTAYYITAGSTQVTLTPNTRCYFLFAPSASGKYEISASDGLTVSYLGAPHFIQDNHLGERTEKGFTLSIKDHMIGDSLSSAYVIGVDAADADSCVLTVDRIGDPDWGVEDEPWNVLQPTVELSKYTLPAGANIQEFDLTKKYTVVLNETDGFYHLDTADGPLVLVRLGEPSAYLDSFKDIEDNSSFCKYFFEEDGTFIKKESYDECMRLYLENMDEERGFYPLTEDLKYIIEQRGDYAGWFDSSSPNYIFKDINGDIVPGIDPETAWLFVCCILAK